MADYINGDGLLFVLKDIDKKYTKDSELAQVAKSGSYGDLKDTPAIPPAVIVDDVLNVNSTNAVSNKAVTEGLNKKATQIDLDAVSSTVEGLKTTKIDASEVSTVGKTGKYTDLTGKPTKLTDFTNDGNFVADSNYVHTDNNYTAVDKTKLAGIADGAQINKIESVKVNGVAQTVTAKEVDIPIPTKVSQLNNDSGFLSTETDPTVPQWAKAATKPTYTANEVGAIASTMIGIANGVCPLGTDKMIDASYLPSYVDDVIEAYIVTGAVELTSGWLSLEPDGKALVPEKGKIYVIVNTGAFLNSQYRWGGTTYVKITSDDMVALTNEEIEQIIATV